MEIINCVAALKKEVFDGPRTCNLEVIQMVGATTNVRKTERSDKKAFLIKA